MFPWSLLSSLLAEVKAMELHKFHLAFKNILSESFRVFKFNCVSFIYSGYIKVIFPERYATFSGSSLVLFWFEPDLRKKKMLLASKDGSFCFVHVSRFSFHQKYSLVSPWSFCKALKHCQHCPSYSVLILPLPLKSSPVNVLHPGWLAQWHILPSWRPCSPLHCRSLMPFP